MKELLLQYIKDNNIIQQGSFKLSSGSESSFYIDGRKLTLSPKGLDYSITLLIEQFAQVGHFDAVGGPSVGADPILTAILLALNCKGFMVRKEPKDHGTGQLVEGPVSPGMDVVMVEDTVTTGASVIKAIKAARDFGLNVKAVGSIFFRGTDSPFKVPFFHLFKVNDQGVIEEN